MPFSRHSILYAAIAWGFFLHGAGCDRARETPTLPRGASATQPAILPPMTPLAEYDGRIEHLLIHCKDGLVGQASKPVYDLLGAIRDGTRVTFACDSEAAQRETLGRMKQYSYDRRLRIETRRVAGPISVWPRDRYVFGTVRDGGNSQPVCLLPAVAGLAHEPSRLNERAGAAALFGGLIPPLRIAPTDLVLEGGNLLASTEGVFIGANVLADNASSTGGGAAREWVQRTFAPPVTLVGDDSGAVPFVHLDMYFTVFDTRHVLVASPALGAEAMKGADDESRRELAARLMGREADASPARQKRFDDVARRLAADGYTVTRLPYADCLNGDFMVTYNNVLQETVDGHRVVYMPTWRIPALDAAARRAYEQLGAKVHTVDVAPIAHLNGAVRCMANVIERRPDGQP